MLWEVVCGFLFLVSSGLLFNEKFRKNNLLILATAAIAIVSTYFLTIELVGSIVASKLREAQEVNSSVNISNTATPETQERPSLATVGADQPTSIRAPSPTPTPEATPTPMSVPNPSASVRVAGELAAQWQSGKLYGSDNGAAALMAVRIRGVAGAYTVTIENQMGFVCQLGVGISGDPAYVEGCRSTEGWRTDRNRISLRCANNSRERVCQGDYIMISDSGTDWPGVFTIARRL